jgi:hypothetical protein
VSSNDPRRAREITTRIRGVADKRHAFLTIDGQRWAVVEWGGPGRWCIEDDQGRCLTHAEDTRGIAPTLADAIELAEAMIRDGRMPSPEQAKQLADERREKQQQQRDAWSHPERLYEPLADTLELWIERDPGFTRSNSYQRLRDELIAIAVGALGHFEQVRESALRALHQIESEGRRSHWYGENAEAARAQIAYAEEHLERARQIIRVHDPNRTPAIPAPGAITAEQVIEEARAARTARATRRRREAARDPDGTKRAKRRAMNSWRSNAGMVRFYAASLTDAELLWFTEIDKATRDRAIRRHPDDALRLRDLRAALSQRSSEQHTQQRQSEDRAHAERLKRLATSGEPQPGETAA